MFNPPVYPLVSAAPSRAAIEPAAAADPPPRRVCRRLLLLAVEPVRPESSPPEEEPVRPESSPSVFASCLSVFVGREKIKGEERRQRSRIDFMVE